MRVVAWNMNAMDRGWSYLWELDPDIALLSEVKSVELDQEGYSIVSKRAARRTREPQRFSTALVTRAPVTSTRLETPWEWVDQELESMRGNFVTGSHGELNLISAYSPAWPIMKRQQLAEIPTASEVKLKHNPELWGTELLWAMLKAQDLSKPWVVGGDLNACETFDLWNAKPRGNRELLDRMEHLGFTELLRASAGEIVPTYYNSKTKQVRNQMDHLWVTQDLAARVVRCVVGDADIVFGEKLSDHLPIIADLA